MSPVFRSQCSPGLRYSSPVELPLKVSVTCTRLIWDPRLRSDAAPYFSEAVSTVMELDVTQIVLQSHSNISQPGTENYTLTESSIIIPTVQASIIYDALTSGSGYGSGSEMGQEPVAVSNLDGVSDSTVEVIKLSTNDLNEIKRHQNLATTRRNTVYISTSETLVMDTFGNPNMPIFSLMARRVYVFEEDRVNPELVDYALNLSSNELVLTFSETVDVSTFTVSALMLYSDVAASASESLMLSGGTVVTSNDPVVILQLSQEDRNQLRNLTDLAISTESTYLSIPLEVMPSEI